MPLFPSEKPRIDRLKKSQLVAFAERQVAAAEKKQKQNKEAVERKKNDGFSKVSVWILKGQEEQLKAFATTLCNMKSGDTILSNDFLAESEHILDFSSRGENKIGPEAPNAAEDRKDITPSSSLRKSNKDYVNSLRNLPIDRVAKALDYSGETNTAENAIDLTMRISGKTFNDAISWLDQKFGQQ